jgi:hypothetical protein
MNDSLFWIALLNILKAEGWGKFFRDENFPIPRLELIYPAVCRKFGNYTVTLAYLPQ